MAAISITHAAACDHRPALHAVIVAQFRGQL